jgi:hypothetical protein
MSDSNTVYKLLSAEIKTLASRISKQDELIALLQSEIVRLSSGGSATGASVAAGGAGRRGPGSAYGSTGHTNHFKASIPISPTAASTSASASASTSAPASAKPFVKKVRPVIADSESSTAPAPLALSSVLKNDERVTIEVGLTRNEDGEFDSYATCLATFDGSDLVVNGCDLAKDMIGFKTSKPGEILYRFMDALVKGKHIKSKFACPPWKLCSVVRDGVKVSLDELRSKLGGR